MRVMHWISASALAALLAGGTAVGGADGAARPLRVHPDNPRYLCDGSGKAVYLTGSHIWNNFIDWGTTDPPPRLDYTEFLDWVAQHHHNFIRGWVFLGPKWGWPFAAGQPAWYLDPPVFARPGPGRANDGKPRFDLTQVNPEYLSRLRSRVEQARARGIYVGVMLFDCALGEKSARKPPREHNPWYDHPFHADNNTNGIVGDVNGDGEGWEIQQLPHESGVSAAVLELQQAYVEAVIDALHDLDNIIWEIVNEGLVASDQWQNHMIRHIKAYERRRGYAPRLVWKTAHYEAGQGHRVNALLRDSPADVISLNHHSWGDYRRDVPAAEGHQVSILDTDHLWGVGGDAAWVWRSFTRGHHPIFMDPKYGNPWKPDEPAYQAVRDAMGHTRAWAERINLAATTPQSGDSTRPSSTRYCLFAPGAEYLVFQPESGAFTLDLPGGTYDFEWFHWRGGEVGPTGTIRWEGGERTFVPPSDHHRVLYVVRADRVRL